MVFSKLDDNHNKIADQDLWTHDKYEVFRESGSNDWIQLNYQFKIKTHDGPIDSEDQIKDLLTQEWDLESDKINKVLVVENNSVSTAGWKELQLTRWQELRSRDSKSDIETHDETVDQPDKKHVQWFFIYLKDSNEFISPVNLEKISIIKRITNSKRRQLNRAFSKIHECQYIVREIYYPTQNGLNNEIIAQHTKQKEEKIVKWRSKLEKNEFWEEDEIIISAGRATIGRSNWKVRSNFTRRGNFILTNKRLVYTRRSFALIKIAALLPLLAFIRPSNKALLVIQTIYQVIKIPLRYGKAFARPLAYALPAFVGVAFSSNLVNFDGARNFYARFISIFPNFVGTSISVVIQNPQFLPALGGFAILFNRVLFRVFMRNEEILIIPLDQIKTTLLDRNMLVMRIKLKGGSLVKAPENGIEFKMSIRDRKAYDDKNFNPNNKLAAITFNSIMSSTKPVLSSDNLVETDNVVELSQ